MTSPWPSRAPLPNPPHTGRTLTEWSEERQVPFRAIPRPILTDQQAALLGLVAAGHPYTAIARRYGVSTACLGRWLTGIYRRLAARNACHAVAIATRAGLIPAPEQQTGGRR